MLAKIVSLDSYLGQRPMWMSGVVVLVDGDVLHIVALGFKKKTRYAPYVSPESQISHIATNKGNI